MKKKAEIEEAMRKKVEERRRDYLVHADVLQKVVEYKLREVR